MRFRSLAFRLSLWYGLLLALAFALVGTVTFVGVEQYLSSSDSVALLRRARQIENILRTHPKNDAQTLASSIGTQIAPEYTNRFVRITRSPTTPVYLSGLPADRSFDPAQLPLPQNWSVPAGAVRIPMADGTPMLIAHVRTNAADGDYLIEIGSSLKSVEALRQRLSRLLALMLPVLVGLATAGGYVLVRRTLRPVDEMSQTAAKISITEQEARVPVPETGDALERLAVALNDMLARLRDSMHMSQQFLADASHDLRTPLTIIQGELQDLVASPPSGIELADRLGSVLEEVNRLKQLVEGLLAISRLDAGDAKRALENIDLKTLVTSTTDQMRLVAEDAGVSIIYTGLQSAWVTGDPGRLQQVIVNLLDNAIKYTPKGGKVSLFTGHEGRESVLEVRDTGIGIPPAAIPRIFDRFFRVDAARSRDVVGVGLGLSIVRAICLAHGATIRVESMVGAGSRFILRFPASKDPSGAAAPAVAQGVHRPAGGG